MCDRCSPSLFHAPDLNNSPCTDNPCTQDHLHGTAEPRNFRLRPSVCFCSQYTGRSSNTSLLSRRRIAFLVAHSFSRFKHVLWHGRPFPWWAQLGWPGNIFQIQQPPELRCSAAACFLWDLHFQPGCPGITVSSVGHRAVWKHSQWRHHLCWQLQHPAWNSGIC